MFASCDYTPNILPAGYDAYRIKRTAPKIAVESLANMCIEGDFMFMKGRHIQSPQGVVYSVEIIKFET